MDNQIKSINEYVTEAHKSAVKRGFWDEPESVTTARQVVNAYRDNGAIDEYAFGFIMESLELAATHPLSEQIALIHSEASEALEEARKGQEPNETYRTCATTGLPCIQCSPGPCGMRRSKPCGIPSELADIVIRVMDLCGHYGIDLQAAIDEKMAYNRTRTYKHGKVF